MFYLEATIGTNVHLCVNKGTICLQPLKSVSRVAMHLMIAIGSSTVREENHDLVDRLRILAEVVLWTNVSSLTVIR
jgi:hypothetical protein